jgi:two-component sensor histidine kinase
MIVDDGVGFTVPEHRRLSATVGLFLVDVLVEQLGGTFEITSGQDGTRCRVLVPSDV